MGANLGVSAGSVVIPSAANLASWRAFWRVSSSVSSSNCSASDCSAFEFTMGTFVNLGSTAARLSWTPLLSFGTRPLEECFLEDSNVAERFWECLSNISATPDFEEDFEEDLRDDIFS